MIKFINAFLVIVTCFIIIGAILKKVEAGIPCSTWADNPELCNSDLVSKDE